MGKKPISKTEHETFWVEALFGLGHHYKTTISDDKKKAEGRGNTSEESQKIASEKWKSGKTESKDSCYLTTACVESMNLPDNCLELRVLRDFRDRILMQEPSSRKAVKEYYKIAPEIVQAVGERDDAQDIWHSIYRDIKHAVFLVLSGDFKGSFQHYQQMTMRLKEKYLD